MRNHTPLFVIFSSFLSLLVASSLLVLLVCSCGRYKRATAPAADRIAPEVRLLFPFSREPLPAIVSDSTNVYVAARDSVPGGSPGQMGKVELYFQTPEAIGPTRIGEVVTPISLQEIPDSTVRSRLDVPAGWSLYTKRWYTGWTPLPPVGTPVDTGTYVRLFAVATDPAGNRGQTPDSLRILVINASDDGPVFGPRFIIVPWPGRVGLEITFDPSSTRDLVDSNAEIRVRWDFDLAGGDGWDLDWDADARADQIVRHAYSQPGTYRVCMEAHTSYLPDSIASVTRELLVSP